MRGETIREDGGKWNSNQITSAVRTVRYTIDDRLEVEREEIELK